MKSLFLATALALALTGVVRADFNPVQLTPEGYTFDIVVESNAPAALPYCLSATQDGGTSKNGYTWYERGFYRFPYQTTGLPEHGQTFTNLSNSNVLFAMPPDYTLNHCLLIDSALSSGTLVLAPATAVTNLSILGASGGGIGNISYTVTHTDATAETGTLTYPIWLSGPNPAWMANGRVSALGSFALGTGSARLYSTNITVSGASPVASITFTYRSGGHVGIFAVSGNASGSSWVPISLTGFNQRVIVPNSFPLTATMDQGTNTAYNSGLNTWYERGYVPGYPASGLPPAGSTFSSRSQPTHHYQAGSYAANNAVLIDAAHRSANLTPATPVTCSFLALLASGGDIQAGYRMTNFCVVQHADGSSETNLFIGYDWYEESVPGLVAWEAGGRVNMANRTINGLGSANPKLFENYIPLTNTTSPVTNIIVGYRSAPFANATTCVLGVSASTEAILILTQPKSLTAVGGATVQFSVGVLAADASPPAYQWRKNGLPLMDGGNISGTASPVLTLGSIVPDDQAGYSVIVSNTAGAVTSAVANLTVIVPQSTVDWNDVHQRIDGFGGGVVFLTPSGLEPVSDRNMDTLFGENSATQLGLSLLRVRIDPYGNWAYALADARKAIMRGAGVLATPWTPPPSMKDNNSTIGGSLLPTEYTNYANYLNGFAASMASNGAPLRAISVQNEPDFVPTDYEGCGWTADQLQTFFHGAAGLITNAPVLMPESASYDQSLSEPALNDPAAAANMSIIGEHLYGNGDFGVAIVDYPNAHNKGKPTWMTEFLVNDQTWSTALVTAEQIHDCLTVGNMSAYIWWKCLGDANGLVNAGGIPQKRGFVMAQFSRFVRPGYNRIGTANSGAALISAYQDANSGQFAIVAINPGNTPIYQMFNLLNFAASSVTPWITSDTLSLSNQPPISVSGSSFAYMLPAMSVVTFVGNNVPVITTHPVGLTVAVGETVGFTVAAVGTPPLTYQWLFGGNAIAGATNSALTLSNVVEANQGLYSVLVTNAYGAVLSSNALLVVNQPPVADASATKAVVISSNGTNATVVLNGTRSSDPDGDTLQYTWWEAGQPVASGVVAVVVLPLGAHPFALMVNDGMLSATNAFTIDVISPSEAVIRLMAQVESSWSRPHPLEATLAASLASIERGNSISAINQLLAFQNQVRAQVAPSDAALAASLIQAAQEVIDALSGSSTNPSGRPHGRFNSLVRQPNGRMQLEFRGETGHLYLLEASTNLVSWDVIGVAVDHGDGTFGYEDAGAAGHPNRFYRIMSP